VRLWFIDEFGVHLGMTRDYARTPRGERAEVVERFERGVNISVISALTLEGVRAPMMIEGAIDADVLEEYIKHILAPELHPGDIVLWDNVAIHKKGRVIAQIEATGARIEPLPAYSPDLDPIEECVSKVKACLRKVKAETTTALQHGLKWAFDQVTPEDIRGWFQHCGYVLT
jgi:transposase